MGKVILVVEDDAGLWSMYRHVLRKFPYQIEFVRSGDEALEILEKKQPVLIFLDIRLPIISGEEILEKIHQEKRLISTPVVVTTSMREEDIHIPGAYYLRKPIRPEIIGDYAERLLHIEV
ncbi:MAG: response regulator [Anaerolineae bacterium]|nr:response regulator [Anaerolineae bacterium]